MIITNNDYYSATINSYFSETCMSIVVTLGTPKVVATDSDLLAQVKIYAIDSIWTLPPGCYREVACDRYIQVPLY